jgi:hypothetical protein
MSVHLVSNRCVEVPIPTSGMIRWTALIRQEWIHGRTLAMGSSRVLRMRRFRAEIPT